MSTTASIPLIEFLAMAPSGSEQGPGGLMGFLPMILIFVAFYFLLIRPQRQKEKKLKNMIAALEKGSKVKTVGGLYGTVTGVKDDRFVLRIAENVKIEVAKEAVAAKVD